MKKNIDRWRFVWAVGMVVYLILARNTLELVAGVAGTIGASLNLIVTWRNGWYMPSRLARKTGYVKITPSTKLTFLGDVIPIQLHFRSWDMSGYMSIGDIFLYISIVTATAAFVVFIVTPL